MSHIKEIVNMIIAFIPNNDCEICVADKKTFTIVCIDCEKEQLLCSEHKSNEIVFCASCEENVCISCAIEGEVGFREHTRSLYCDNCYETLDIKNRKDYCNYYENT